MLFEVEVCCWSGNVALVAGLFYVVGVHLDEIHFLIPLLLPTLFPEK